MILPNLFGKLVVGIDEAGRGPFSGPVFAAAVILNSDIEGINDSKLLSKKKREVLFDKIILNSKYGVGIATVEEIGKINILQASLLAMRRAFNILISAFNDCGTITTPDFILIDGNKNPLPDLKNSMTIIGGDRKIKAISAASIIAKVSRDIYMENLSSEFPEYLWHKNSGYGTQEHISAIKKHGVTKHHRLSFLKNIKA